jgi:hypothetical protein
LQPLIVFDQRSLGFDGSSRQNGEVFSAEGSMSESAMRWYRSKVDWWLGLILMILPISPIVVCISLAASGKASELPFGIAAFVFVAMLFVGVVFPVRYGVGDEKLVVRFGLCRFQIPVADIREVYPTRNPLSSPALSLDRLYVKFGDGFSKAVMISPADRDQFLDDLAGRTGLARDGDRLFRS